MSFAITTDSCCDLSVDFLRENNISFAQTPFFFGQETYTDDLWQTFTPEQFYDRIKKGEMPSTAQINPSAMMEIFEPHLKAGCDVLHIGFSTGLSGTTTSAFMAATEMKEKYPNNRVVVVDTMSASTGVGIMVYMANKMRGQGKSLDDIAKWIDDNKMNLNHEFTVDDLMHLFRGGRVSRTSAILGGMMGIKPTLCMDTAGKLAAKGKARGRKAALNALVEEMVQNSGKQHQVAALAHGNCLEDAEYVRDLMNEKFEIEHFIFSPIGPSIGTHSGPGTVTIMFFGTPRK